MRLYLGHFITHRKRERWKVVGGTPKDCPELRDRELLGKDGEALVAVTRWDSRTIFLNLNRPKTEWPCAYVHERGHVALEELGVTDHHLDGSLTHEIIDAIANEIARNVRLPAGLLRLMRERVE